VADQPVLREPVSGGEFPAKQGKIGNISKIGRFLELRVAKAAALSNAYRVNSYPTEQGIQQSVTGNDSYANREIRKSKL